MKFYPLTKKLLESIKKEQPQSLLLTGPKGIGLLATARYLGGRAITSILKPISSKGSEDETGTISIESIRLLYDHTRAKRLSKQIVIIDNAERMSPGAQAAFLKLLEEPNSATHFILTSHAPHTLLPTIHSRVQQLELQPLSQPDSAAFIQELGITDTTKQTQLQFLAAGLPAELTRLTQDETYFKAQAIIISDARTLIQASTYDKLLLLQKYRSNREGTVRLCESAILILKHTLKKTPNHSVVKQMEQLLEVKEKLIANQNSTLQLATIVL